MNKAEFLDLLIEEIEIESLDKLEDNTKWADVDEYDSLAVMSIVALVDEHFDVKLKAQDFNNFTTVGDLLKKIGL